jgi:membrane associated rhomboid family serine protease
MQTEHSFSDILKNQWRTGGMTVRLITINVCVFLFLGFIEVLSRLIGENGFQIYLDYTFNFFHLDTSLSNFIVAPWTIVTSIFAHVKIFHLLSNMLMLYFSGQLFEQLFDRKRLLYTYLLGGIFGGILEIIAHLLFPNLGQTQVIGASGAIMAIFAALAFYRPNLQVMFFGLFPVKIIVLAGIFILIDFLSLGVSDGTAHFAHLGGVILGLISIKNLHSRTNIVTAFQRFIESIGSLFQTLFGKRNPKMKVQKGGRQANFKSDEEYNLEAKQRQIKIDAILDKIAKSGYESLTKAEKDFLFKQSKNG